jgi:hypothetical protein
MWYDIIESRYNHSKFSFGYRDVNILIDVQETVLNTEIEKATVAIWCWLNF